LTPNDADELRTKGWRFHDGVCITPPILRPDDVPAVDQHDEWWVFASVARAVPRGGQTSSLYFTLAREALSSIPAKAATVVRAEQVRLWEEVETTDPESVFLAGTRLIVITRTALVSEAIASWCNDDLTHSDEWTA
jgi:hypothetical protein